MKIGFVIVSDFVGGAEREILDYASALKNDGGIGVVVIIDSANTEFATLLEANGIPIERSDFQLQRNRGVAGRGLGNLWRVYQQARTLQAIERRHALDLVITYSFHSGVIGAVARLLGMRAKLVLGEVTQRELTRGGAVEHLQFFAADGVTYNSNALRAAYAPIASRYGRPEAVVYSYVKKPALSSKRGARDRLVAEQRWPADAVIIGFFGRLFEYKRVADVIEAAGRLHASAPGRFFLVVTGSAPQPTPYEMRMKALAESRCPGSYCFLPFTNDPFPLMAACDVIVIPSIEPFGRVVVEAMYLGVPFVATDAGGPKEIMAYGDPRCGRLVPPMRPDLIADAIVEIINGRTADRPPVPHVLTREGIIAHAVQFYRQLLGRAESNDKHGPSGQVVVLDDARQRRGAAATDRAKKPASA